MAFSLASSLCRCKRFDATDIACAYVRWEQSAPPDIGIATHFALHIGTLSYFHSLIIPLIWTIAEAEFFLFPVFFRWKFLLSDGMGSYVDRAITIF